MHSRREPRFNVRSAVKVAAIDQPAEVSAAVLLDVSGSGMNIISDRNWPVGSRLVVEMENHLVLARVCNGDARGSKFSLGAEKLHSILKLMLPLDAPRAEWHRILLAEADQTTEPPLKEPPSSEPQATAHSVPHQPNPDQPVIDQPTLPAAQVLDEQALDAQTVALLMRDLQELDQQESMAQNVLRERTPENVLPVAPPPATAGPDPSQALEENAHRISRPVPITRPEEHNDPPFASGSSLLPASSPRPREVGISPDVAPYFGPASIPDVPKTRLRWIISAGVAAGLSAVVALAFYLGPFRLSISTANSTAVARPPETPLTIPPVTEKQPVAPATAQTTVARTPSSITTAPVPTPIARAASLPAPERARRATVKASGMNWVSACSDGQAAFAGLLSAGDVRDIDFQRTAVIRVGNAAAAEIDVNGKSIGSLGPPGAVKILEISGAGLRFLPVNLSPEAECQPKP